MQACTIPNPQLLSGHLIRTDLWYCCWYANNRLFSHYTLSIFHFLSSEHLNQWISSSVTFESPLVSSWLTFTLSQVLWNNRCILENPLGVATKTARALQPAAYNMSSGRAEQYRRWSEHSHIHTLSSAERQKKEARSITWDWIRLNRNDSIAKKLTAVWVQGQRWSEMVCCWWKFQPNIENPPLK